MKYRLKMFIAMIVSAGVWVALPQVVEKDTAFPLMIIAMLLTGVFLARAVLGDPEIPNE